MKSAHGMRHAILEAASILVLLTTHAVQELSAMLRITGPNASAHPALLETHLETVHRVSQQVFCAVLCFWV